MNLRLSLPALTLCLFLFSFGSIAQTNPFQEEVDKLIDRIENKGWERGSVLFTGSSSIRFWMSLNSDFPDQKIINTGFGGSKASDLITFLPQLVLNYAPSKVFIYEGDNDLWAEKEVAEIMGDLDHIVKWIKKDLPNTKIYLISAKPSPARWSIKNSYLALNKSMKEYAIANQNVSFVDVWDSMLGEDGQPKPDIFIADKLHMNDKGYAIWKEAFAPFIED